MIKCIVILSISIYTAIDAGVLNDTWPQSRRILKGHVVGETRPYMVFLRPALDAAITDSNWLCGGVIIHERYVLTSAACIEEAKHFYVISGTNKWVPVNRTNECIKNGAKKAVWKCVPKSYSFDGNEFNNIRWMSNDIAVVKVEDEFNFQRRIRGCQFIPKKIPINKISPDLEKPGSVASIAGWGSTASFGDILGRPTRNSRELLETDVVLISKKNCKKRWDPRYHQIIQESMICGKDSMDTESLRAVCSDRNANCKDLVYSDEEYKDSKKKSMRKAPDPKDLEVHTAYHDETRRMKTNAGGFCENDHGGPLVSGQGASAVVIGVISACQSRDVTRKCFGPFLFSSVWKNRFMISCAIGSDAADMTCRKQLSSENNQITSFDWSNYADGQQNDSMLTEAMPVVFRAKPQTTEGYYHRRTFK